MSTILITGAAGFIGAALALRLLGNPTESHQVIGLDNLNDYYDVRIKEARLAALEPIPGFRFIRGDMADRDCVDRIFEQYRPEIVVNLAAQAGVRYSIENPQAYMDSNVTGFFHLLEACRRYMPRHLVFASSSSVYGANSKTPYSVEDKADLPVSLYAATKKSNELFAHAYSKLYGIPTTGLRFFTVYGPLGRPDMAYFSFTRAMTEGRPIRVFNHGDMYRDFTYIDDVTDCLTRILPSEPPVCASGAAFKVCNIGNSKPESLMFFIETLEKALIRHGLIAKPCAKEFLPMQPGDVYQTCADVGDLEERFGFRPHTPLAEGLDAFVRWYRSFYSTPTS